MREPRILRHATNHREHRANAYPSHGDALDVIAKAFRAIADGKPIPPEAMAWVENCEAVKARFPKKPG
ncbi:hypothetical protein [Methylobacterium trifolii]|uniref:Uncharacterized protein n=1 Tax=Methylobacterium trifolii TaxID=1003092 RepID=A0ABQ4U3U8_9HYPH|nr:hypothetical protein [Methylobacterium trifolii]GJE61698.1 hypothetical protein MPOCJGCO_3821 [Methylobacterium trifolii]